MYVGACEMRISLHKHEYYDENQVIWSHGKVRVGKADRGKGKRRDKRMIKSEKREQLVREG